jgi:hypothetical protein
MGLPPMPINGLGVFKVASPNLVPFPPARITAIILFKPMLMINKFRIVNIKPINTRR